MDSVSLCRQCMKWSECYRLRLNRDDSLKSDLGGRKSCFEERASIILDIEVGTADSNNQVNLSPISILELK